MAFPLSAVLDNFNRTDATSLGANWTVGMDFGGTDNPHIISNQTGFPSGESRWAYFYYNVSTYGPDCEVYIDVSVTATTCDSLALGLRVVNPGATYDGYILAIDPETSTNNGGVLRIDDGVSTQLGAAFSQQLDSGDSAGMSMIGTTIRVYFNNDGAGWTEITSRTDGTYTAAGYLQNYWSTDDTSLRYDNFGGGTVTTSIWQSECVGNESFFG